MSADTNTLRRRHSHSTGKIDVLEDPQQKATDPDHKPFCSPNCIPPEEEEESGAEENETVFEAVLNVAKNGLGVGIYFIAALMTQSGVYYISILLCICAFISALGFYYIGKACNVSRTKTYEGLFRAAFGKKYSWICSVIISGFTFIVILLYTLMLGFFTHYTFKELGVFDTCEIKTERNQNTVGIVVVLVTCGIPISFFKKISYFKYTSAVGLAGVIFSGILHFLTHWYDSDVPDLKWKYYPEEGQYLQYITPIAVVSASFNCHFNAANYYSSVGGDMKKFKDVTIYSFLIMLCTAGSVGYFSYINFGASKDIYENAAPSIFGYCNDDFQENNPGFWKAGMGACFLVGLNVAFGIGLCLFPLRFSIYELWNKLQNKSVEKDNEMTDTEHTYITSGLLFIVLIVALSIVQCTKSEDKGASIDAIIFVFDLLVCLLACHVAFTLPGIMYLKVEENPTLIDQIICYVLIASGSIASVTGFIKILF